MAKREFEQRRKEHEEERQRREQERKQQFEQEQAEIEAERNRRAEIVKAREATFNRILENAPPTFTAAQLRVPPPSVPLFRSTKRRTSTVSSAARKQPHSPAHPPD
jgi:hypothetical protein